MFPAPDAPQEGLTIGLMSGTSLDGVDGVLARHLADGGIQVLAHAHRPYSAALRAEFLALNQPGENELHRAALAGNALARLQAEVVRALLTDQGLASAEVLAVGSHGQTVRHQPGAWDGTGYTLQINQPALLAELCGMAVVADFRSRDVAAGGQGAPLVPAFHARVFGRLQQDLAVLNLGGIGNLTLLPAQRPQQPVRGFDCGPGNALLDHWVQQHRGQPFDEAGQWAATGRVNPGLLTVLLAEPFLALPPPKSTGRDLFHPGWLAAKLSGFEALPAQDIQATLSAFTAQAAAQAVQRHLPGVQTLLVCGGGALNTDLMARLQALLPACAVHSTAQAGLPPMEVEAAAFAWLAWAHLRGESGALTEVTGARVARILGAYYPA